MPTNHNPRDGYGCAIWSAIIVVVTIVGIASAVIAWMANNTNVFK